MEKCDKRDAVIQAALELVAEHGFHGAPMALVAERAGVAAGTIYRYFEGKDELIVEVYRSLEARMLARVLSDYPEGRPVRERFLHIGRGVAHYMIDYPIEFRFLEQFHNSPYGVDHRREKLLGAGDGNVVIELLEGARGEQIVKDLPTPVLFALTFGPLIAVCRDAILGFIKLDDALIDRSVEACWDAVRR
jgi:AcrR family transcriptional regulator